MNEEQRENVNRLMSEIEDYSVMLVAARNDETKARALSSIFKTRKALRDYIESLLCSR